MDAARVFVYGARTGEVPETVLGQRREEPEFPVNLPPFGSGARRGRRRMFRRLPFGYVKGIYPFGRDTNDTRTLVDGLNKRIRRELPAIDAAVLRRFETFVSCWVKRELSPLGHHQMMTFEEWLDSCPYPQERKEDLRRTYAQLNGGFPTRAQASKVECFMKTESYPISDTFKAGRWIMSRSDKSKVILGPIFKSIERVVYNRHEFIKHVPVADRHRVVSGLRASNVEYIITDYTAFESSFHPDLMKVCEVAMYKHMLTNFPKEAAFVDRTLTGVNKLTTRNGVSTSIRGRRMSGEMCTSLGNGFTNLMLMAFICEESGATWNGLVEGDDGIFAISGPVPTPEQFAALGFEIKLAKIRDPTLGGFCGLVAASSGLIRDPVRFFQTFGWTTNSVTAGDKVMKELLRAKALSTLYETPCCPIVAAVAARAYELTNGVNPRWQYDGYHITPLKDALPPQGIIDPDTRALFHELYGVTPIDQIRLEKRIAGALDLDFLADFISHHHNHDLVEKWFVGG